ncbi:hypothetical protein BDW22DRAFT_1361046 [Trametopsis cervina]|nr:hypothetical protein BDW22DRAFT_1361046 [Trametopsis cervina]
MRLADIVRLSDRKGKSMVLGVPVAPMVASENRTNPGSVKATSHWYYTCSTGRVRYGRR